MIQLRLFYDEHDEEGNVTDEIAIRCSNCSKDTRLHLNDKYIEEMITKFMLNAILYHMCMSCIICSNKTMLYEIEESDHPDWLNKVPWYNTAIRSKLHGKMFEDVIAHSRKNIYNLMCSIVAHD